MSLINILSLELSRETTLFICRYGPARAVLDTNGFCSIHSIDESQCFNGVATVPLSEDPLSHSTFIGDQRHHFTVACSVAPVLLVF
jgi:hypothetical protein